ncbi:phage terminase large subunit family protein [Luteimonas sp. M1R5S18]|uniref:Phage terminase large subunit family protein n=1 Tax=Luteimonas rhizosphaericola TaxID=3042024 RepID=A0ABT6JND0_9GAMM|nr:terminase gpA endonuclease subunit [Luteimonas rhizosphaericola]MDH5832157.1 phage terminase large subunit family protein [Luteimonas rhizosphaericola]
MTLDAHGLDVQIADAVATVCDAWSRAWELPPVLTVSEHADRTRIIAKGSGAEPGKWRTARHPMLREIMDCLSDHSPVQVVDFMKSAQIGATEIGINWTNYVIDRGADSMIVAQPVKDLSRSWATSKFDPAVMEMPELLAKLSTDNTLEKRYPGGTLWVIWANSSKQLRQRTARYIFMDEVDEYPRDVGGQGPAVQQLAARAMSYGDRAKIYRACTPTIAGASAIEEGHAEGDQSVYVVQCPHCGAEQTLEIERLQPDGTFACAQSGCVIEEHQKPEMFAERGYGGTAYWKRTNLGAPPHHRSFHAWAAYAPLGLGLSWKQIADMREEAERDPTKMAGFRNLVLGLTYEGERQEQDAEEVAKLAEPGVNLGTVPAWALVLSAGVDFQHDRAEVEIIGTGRGQRRAVIDYAVIDLDPTIPDDYAALDEYLQGTWKNTRGVDMPITAAALDGGNWTEMVAQFVKRMVGTSGSARLLKTSRGHARQTIYLVRGRNERKSERAVYRPSKTEVNQREKTLARSVGVWGVGTSVLKHMVYGWLNAALTTKKQAEEGGEPEDLTARMLRFPGGRGDDKSDPLNPDPNALKEAYWKGLTCEYYDKETGYWIKPKGARNEPLDCTIYAVWASLAPAIKADAMRDSQWEALEAIYCPAVDLFNQPPPSDSRETQPAALAPATRPSDSRETRRRPGGFDTKDGWPL